MRDWYVLLLSVRQFMVSAQFRCATLDYAILTPNSQICVALMVSAPIYVAQKQMSYLAGPPEYKIGDLWVGYYLKTKKYEKYDTENAENDSGAPWRMKNESN